MSETEDRARVVAEARSWLGCPYHHAANVRGAGVDCAFLLIEVFSDLGLIERFDPRPYSRDFMLHRDEEKYLGQLLARARPVEILEPGDVIMFRVGRLYAHGGIVTRAEPLSIVHAFAPAGCVVEEDIHRCGYLQEKMPNAKFFSYWGG